MQKGGTTKEKTESIIFNNYASKNQTVIKQYTEKSKEYQYSNIQTSEGISQHAYMTHDSQKVKLVRSILEKKGNDLSHVLVFIQA